MPIIPDFQNTIAVPAPGAGPTANVANAGAVGDAIANAAAKVGGALDEWNQRYAEARRQSDAAQRVAAATKEMGDAQFTWSKHPDAQEAYEGFQRDAARIQAAAIEGTRDPLVQSHLTRVLGSEAIARSFSTRESAFHVESSTRLGDLHLRGSQYSSQIANATSPELRAMAIDNLAADVRGSVAAGWLRADQGVALVSSAVSAAVLRRAEVSPGDARQMYEQYRTNLTIGDDAHVMTSLRGALNRDAVAGAVMRSVGLAPPGGAGVVVAQAGDVESQWARIKQLESGGQHWDPRNPNQPLMSSAGAIGISQLMPDTARGRAAALGVPYDAGRVQSDPAYNEMLGKAEYQALLVKYGSPMLAAAAYNAGSGRVDGWIRQFGDPRTGAVSPQDFAAKIPFAETQNYVRKFGIDAVSPPPVSPTPDGPPARGVMPYITGIPPLAQMLETAMRETAGMRPEQRLQVLEGVRTQHGLMQQAATGDLTHMLDVKAKLEAAARHDLERAQDAAFAGLMGKFTAGEGIPGPALTGALAAQSINRAQYDFMDKLLTQRREGIDEPRTVLDLSTRLITEDQQPRILAAANEGRLANHTAVDLIRRNAEARQKPFENAEQLQGFQQVTALVGGDKPLVRLNDNEARRVVMAQQEYIDRVKAGAPPRDIVTDIAARYTAAERDPTKLPVPRFGVRPDRLEVVTQQMEALRAARGAGSVSAADYDREARLLGDYAAALQARAPAPAQPRGAGQRPGAQNGLFGGGR